jgi:hypothetical protein
MVVKRLHKRVYRECIAEDRREMMRAPGKDSCKRIDQRVPVSHVILKEEFGSLALSTPLLLSPCCATV